MPSLSYLERVRIWPRFRFHGFTDCYGRITEAQQPKLLGVGMILYRRYLGITVETSSFEMTHSRAHLAGHRQSRKNGPSLLSSPSRASVPISIYLLIEFIKVVTIRGNITELQRDRRGIFSTNFLYSSAWIIVAVALGLVDLIVDFTTSKLDTVFDSRHLFKIRRKWCWVNLLVFWGRTVLPERKNKLYEMSMSPVEDRLWNVYIACYFLF